MANTFTPRLTRPEAGNKYYITKSAGGYSNAIKGSPTDATCNVLANCVGYAYGRFNEIVGEGACTYLAPVNAENFMSYKGNLETGMEPRLGACMVWQKGATLQGSDGAGHVAIVEKIVSPTEIVTSESGWGAKTPFWTQTRKKGDGNWGAGAGYKFLGFIYNPAACCKTTSANTAVNQTGGITMSNSPLVTYTNWSPNKNSPRNMPIDRISIHCFVGQVTAQRGSDVFKPASKQASCQYVVGKDGDVSQNVDEKDRSWCTSSSANDNRAITIEVASDAYHPYAVTTKAYATLLNLCEDICRRNGKKKLLWFGDKDTTLNYKPAADEMVLTVHRWFANKACPGQYLYDRQANIAKEVTSRLGSAPTTTPTTSTTTTPTQPAPSASFLVRVTASALNIRKSPTTASAITGCIRDKGVYTIVEVNGKWGRLKSGAGWIHLDYTKRV